MISPRWVMWQQNPAARIVNRSSLEKCAVQAVPFPPSWTGESAGRKRRTAIAPAAFLSGAGSTHQDMPGSAFVSPSRFQDFEECVPQRPAAALSFAYWRLISISPDDVVPVILSDQEVLVYGH